MCSRWTTVTSLVIAGLLEKLHLKPNQITYLHHSWREFQKVKETSEQWTKRKSTSSPLLAKHPSVGIFDLLNESFRMKGSEVPKLDIKFDLDKYESNADIEIDPNEW